MASKSKKKKCVFEKQVVLLLVSTRKVETIGSLISAEKATFQREKCLASLYKQWTMSSVRASNSGCTWIVGRALRLCLEHLFRYLRALPTISVYPESEGRTLTIVQSLKKLISAYDPVALFLCFVSSY